MDINFNGKRALITGGGRGFGRHIATRLAKYGATVFVIDRIAENLEHFKSEVPSIKTFCLDITDWDLTRKTVEDIGEIDLLVNNAGVAELAPFLETTKEDLYNITTINYLAAFNIAQVVSKGMVSRGTGGSIVNISSIAGTAACTTLSAYCCSKAAIHMLSKTMAFELGRHKIRVNSVGPTVTLTDMGMKGWGDPEAQASVTAITPLGRLAEIDDVVNAVMFLLSDKASMISGTFLPVDGGVLSGLL